MKSQHLILATLVIFLLAPSCVRRPSLYSRTLPNQRENSSDSEECSDLEAPYARTYSRSNRVSRAIHSITHDTSLTAKVQQLANQVESKFKGDSYSADDLEKWTNLYIEYVMEYYMSTQNLTDEQCESIEYNLGKIAGAVYLNGIVPVMDEIEKISEGVENYEERSKKWEGAAERGFKSVAGDEDSDLDL